MLPLLDPFITYQFLFVVFVAESRDQVLYGVDGLVVFLVLFAEFFEEALGKLLALDLRLLEVFLN